MLTSTYKDRVRRSISLYRDRGFTLYERCSQVRYHTPRHCYMGRERIFGLPSGKAMVQEATNPYCKRTEREVGDWWALSMAFSGGKKLGQHSPCITWKLSMQYLGQEVASPGLSEQTDMAWVDVEGFRKYYQHSATKVDNAVNPDLPFVDLNEFY
ncbi:hypothetical protein BKA70DRAFT_1460829 [Coprinopsis sp. MPI-PUGE-AT-0042]|nr:hypothetical protein BKA70DRAFT_1460829 [Coprinopsis sp. MPI-PUGE-AT-0042]